MTGALRYWQEDSQIFGALCLGGAGAITAAAHIRTDLFVRMANAVAASRLDEARRLHFALLPLIDTLFVEPKPGRLKAALGAGQFLAKPAVLGLQSTH